MKNMIKICNKNRKLLKYYGTKFMEIPMKYKIKMNLKKN